MRYQLVKMMNVRQAHVRKDGKDYLASFSGPTVSLVVRRPEVLVFPANKDGEIEIFLQSDEYYCYHSIMEFLADGRVVE